MKYILIDTNCWAIDLLSSDGNNYLLETLETWVASKQVTLLVPEIIKAKEWPKVKDIYIKNFKNHSEKILETVEKSISPLHTLINVQISSYANKAARITALIDMGICYEPSMNVMADMANRQMKNLAPFHNREKNVADAIIYFSSIDFAEQNEITELYFISRNSKDFQASKTSEDIHEGLKHPKIDIRFFLQLGHAIHELQKELPGLTRSTAFESDKDYISQFIVFEKGTPPSIIDQLDQALGCYYDQLPFIPTHVLARLFPFKISKEKSSHVYHSSFALHTNNEELGNLLETVEITDGSIVSIGEHYLKETTEANEKVYSSLRKLNDNLIFDIHCRDNSKEKDIRLKENRVCNCIRCCYGRMEFSTALRQIRQTQDEPSEQIKQAFIQYRFGNFSSALNTFYSVYKYATSNSKPLLGFICLYNLKRLQHFIRGHFSKTNETTEQIFHEIESISLDRYILTSSSESGFVRENMKWINDTAFYNETYIDLVNVVDKIKEHYLSQLAGGWSSNSHLAILISQFAEIDIYLERNCIIFSNYTQFRTLFNRFVEGLFMSHQLSEKQSSRLDAFDDYLLTKLIFNGETSKIIKYLNRYHISSLRYKPSSGTDKTIDQTMIHLFEDALKLIELTPGLIEENGYFFRIEHNRILMNSFVVIAYTELPEEKIQPIAAALIALLETSEVIRKTDHEYLARFILKKGKYFHSESIKKLVRLSIEKDWMHDPEMFRALQHQIKFHHPQGKISDKVLYETVVANFFEECPKCKTFHHADILVKVYEVLSDDLKDDLSKRIDRQLEGKFNAKSFYFFAIYEIIDHKNFLPKYIGQVHVPKEIGSDKHWHCEGEVLLPDLNELVNLCFKNKINMTSKEFERFKGVSDYYDWLLDMEGFDYSKFKPEWILEYQTDYYLKKIFSIPQAKQLVKQYIKTTKNPRMSEYYIENS